ncbi:MAG: LysR family transcriptional regulator [Rhizobiaceae bacterium]
MSINYDFADLEVFLTVKETGSFHLAAQRLNISQSAISRRIQKLETALGSVLFERTTRSVKPTLAAKRLQPRAEAILDDAEETARAMRDESVAFSHQRGLVVTVASIPTVIAGLIPTALRQFRADGFSSRIRILDFAANEVSEAVAQGEADFGLCSIPKLEPNTEFETLFEDPMVLAMPGGHSLGKREAVTWQDIATDQLILPARGTGNRLLIDEALASARETLRWSFEVERSTTALALVAGGSGLALLPLSAMLNQEDRRMIWRPLAAPNVSRSVGLLTRTGQSYSPESTALQKAIRGAAHLKL